MSKKVTIRLAVPSDLRDLIALATTTITHSCKKEYGPEQLSAWKNALSKSDCLLTSILYEYFVVAIKEEKVVGFGSIDQGHYLNYLYVDHQLQRTGIARQISESLLGEATRLGTKKVTTHASLTAIPFFERIGFQKVEKNTKTIDGVAILNYLMKKVLK